MNKIADGLVIIQTSSESVPSTPSRARGSRTDRPVSTPRTMFWPKSVSVCVLRGGVLGTTRSSIFLPSRSRYAISGERTLEAFYTQLQPFAGPFMALFDRDQLPARSTLSRFLAALTEEPIEALRTFFLDDLLSRPLSNEKQTGGLVDRAGNAWVVFDIDGTREAASPRALPQIDELPAAIGRLDDVCAAFLQGAQTWASRANADRH
jgi:hypothetical protein